MMVFQVQLAEQQEDIYLYFEEQQIIWSTEEEVQVTLVPPHLGNIEPQDDPNDMDDQEDLWWQLNLDCVDEKEEEAMEDVEMLDEFAGLNISSQEDAMEK